jgi:hypothetical protein
MRKAFTVPLLPQRLIEEKTLMMKLDFSRLNNNFSNVTPVNTRDEETCILPFIRPTIEVGATIDNITEAAWTTSNLPGDLCSKRRI